MRHVITLLAVPLLLVGGCDWVDSTGAQSGDAPASVPIVFSDFAPGEVLPLLEDGELRFGIEREAREGDVYTWSEEPLEQGVLDSCAGLDGFLPDRAADTLEAACRDAEDCAFTLERDAGLDEGEVGFVARAPVLGVSVGLRHRLSVATADGAAGSAIHDFCLIAVNEAPEAVDDGPFTVTEGSMLVVGGPGDPDNLLANDSDDDGVEGLVVDTTPVSPPSTASAFELGADGSFSYTFDDVGIRGSFEDSFVYAVSDGVTDPVEARVTLTIVPFDRPPILALPIRPIEAFVGQSLETNPGAGFSDPDGETLTFELRGETSLPPSGSLTFGSDGVLSGVPLAEDVGDYDLRFVASDGVRETEGQVALSIRMPPNRAPLYVAGSGADLTLPFLRPVNRILAGFDDPDGDPLTFELIGTLPRGLAFDAESGRLTGRPRVRGDFTGLRVRAIDPSGATGVSIAFSILVP